MYRYKQECALLQNVSTVPVFIVLVILCTASIYGIYNNLHTYNWTAPSSAQIAEGNSVVGQQNRAKLNRAVVHTP